MSVTPILRRRSKLPVPPEPALLQARAAHLRGEIFHLRPACTQHLRGELAGPERRMQALEASARTALATAGAGRLSDGSRHPDGLRTFVRIRRSRWWCGV